jgi:hypothetical protein
VRFVTSELPARDAPSLEIILDHEGARLVQRPQQRLVITSPDPTSGELPWTRERALRPGRGQ